MSYYFSAVSSLADVIDKLNTFLSGTPGWTTHHVPGSGEFAARKTGTDDFGDAFDVGFASQWSTASPNALGVYHWHDAAYNSGVSPWQQNDDSGNGAASTSDASLLLARRSVITNTPLFMWVFEDDDYWHCVVQTSVAGAVTRFGAGRLTKYNDWTGGEFVYAHRQDDQATDPQLGVGNTCLLDGRTATGTGITNAQLYVATIRVEGMDEQTGSMKYAVCMGNQSAASLGQDRQGSPANRIHFVGGFAAGPMMLALGQFSGTLARGNIPLADVTQFYWNRTSDRVRGPMSRVPGVRHCSIRNFELGEEVVVGSDTWVMFPQTRKTGTVTTGASGHLGVAYLKVTS